MAGSAIRRCCSAGARLDSANHPNAAALAFTPRATTGKTQERKRHPWPKPWKRQETLQDDARPVANPPDSWNSTGGPTHACPTPLNPTATKRDHAPREVGIRPHGSPPDTRFPTLGQRTFPHGRNPCPSAQSDPANTDSYARWQLKRAGDKTIRPLQIHRVPRSGATYAKAKPVRQATTPERWLPAPGSPESRLAHRHTGPPPNATDRNVVRAWDPEPPVYRRESESGWVVCLCSRVGKGRSSNSLHCPGKSPAGTAATALPGRATGPVAAPYK